jgi:hypothetical protein
MAIPTDVSNLLLSIKAKPASVAKDIDTPIRPFLQIAGKICEAGIRDTPDLQKCKYDITKLESIRLHIEALKEQAAIFNDVQFDQPTNQKEFYKLREEAEMIRFEMLSAMDFAFAGDESLLGKASRLREGGSNADLIQDLIDGKVICESNKELLDGIGFDMTILDRAQVLSAQLSDLLAKATLDRSESPEIRIERDKVFTILKGMLQELSRAGFYIHRLDPTRAARYSLTYTSRKRKVKETVVEGATV